MSKAYDRMVAARREFIAAWMAWVMDANTSAADVMDERDGTINAMDQMTALCHPRHRDVVDIRHVCGIE